MIKIKGANILAPFFFRCYEMIKTLIFTGGGSGGHVMPALTLIQELKKMDCDIHYIGGYNSIEKDLVQPYHIKYHPIHNGKLRRYLSVENMKDIFKVIFGTIQAFLLLIKFKKQSTLIFSTGGFVSIPVVVAGWLQGKRIYIHEQTSRVGLANKIASLFADKVFISFEESKKFFPQNKTIYSGYPLRDECFSFDVKDVVLNNKSLLQVQKPILFITGGGNGSQLLNELIKRNLTELKKVYFIVHQVGKSPAEEYQKLNDEDYVALPFVGPEIIDLFKLATITLSRSGAGTVCELIAIGKKSIYVPLKIAQKNEQYHNAVEAKNKLGSIIIEEKDLSDQIFLESLKSFSFPNSRQQVVKENGKNVLINEIKIFLDS